MIIEVDISEQSVEYLKKLAVLGIYGRNPGEVAARMIDKYLIEVAVKQHQPLDFMIATRPKL